MANKARKTEHSGAKKSKGAYYGRKKDAKGESAKRRRKLSRDEVTAQIDNEGSEPVQEIYDLKSMIWKTNPYLRAPKKTVSR